ncbi:hypothetical protein [Paracerasibacillus soli]|uniref:Uncharacterized protein n=1 Tax=Paracerasibacillus soli TaxID=480284 RepID=A0ABU5CLY5_9BACI|nr:hypothetical protein [Virgibacillus soli]MDY0407355.1 hypothetical protein [Virgibacillus soli]
MVEPDRAFKLTTEVLRRKPDSALIWYEDFRDENPLPSNYWITLSGEWEVWKKMILTIHVLMHSLMEKVN